MMKPAIDIDTVKGFLDPEEGRALYSCALKAGALGPVLEVGSYCGKSTVYLGEACREKGVLLYAIDHHRGSEEHQPGEEYHDQDLFDGRAGLMDTFREFRQTMRNAALEDVVVPIVAGLLGPLRRPLALLLHEPLVVLRDQLEALARVLGHGALLPREEHGLRVLVPHGRRVRVGLDVLRDLLRQALATVR